MPSHPRWPGITNVLEQLCTRSLLVVRFYAFVFITVFLSGYFRVASVSCQVSSSLPSKVKYFADLNSCQFGTWERGRVGVNLIPVMPSSSFPSSHFS